MPTPSSSSNALSSISSFPSSYTHTPSYPIHTFSKSMMEAKIESAEPIITRWELNSFSYTKDLSLFNHMRKEGQELLKSVKDLCRAMHFLVSENSPSDKLALAQTLMQIAMKRVAYEFYWILSKHCDQLDPGSVAGQSSDELRNSDEEEEASEDKDKLKRASETTEVESASQFAMSDLKAIADCMISSGYGKECIKIYKLSRKSVVDERLYQLGIEKFKASRIQKLNWEELEQMMKNWLSAVKIVVKTFFSGEKALCHCVFSASDMIKESCFDLWPEIEMIFNSDSTSAIKLQALSSKQKLGDSIRTILSDFESRIQKDSSKTPAIGGGIHPLTESAMSFICSLGDYSRILSEIVAEYPPRNSTVTETCIGGSASPASFHLAWLILVLLCKLDCKAETHRKDVALSYLFLANNLSFIIEKVKTSQLKDLLGDGWLSVHTKKLKQYVLNYETIAWTKVFSSLPEKSSSAITPEAAMECFQRFNAAEYREFFDTYVVMLNGNRNLKVLARFEPDDLGNYLSDMFHGAPILVDFSSSSSCSKSPGCILR